MNKQDFLSTKNDLKLELILLGPSHLKVCLELDSIALNGFWREQQWKTELFNNNALCLGLIETKPKVRENKLVSFACGWTVIDELQITSLAVHPMYRRSGLGKSILSNLLERSKLLGMKSATLEVKHTNLPAQALYKSLGFSVSGFRNNYYRDGSHGIIFTNLLI